MNLAERLKGLLEPILADQQCELVELQIKGFYGSQIIRVFVDRVGGITLDQCEAISRRLSDELDSEEIIPGDYRLEVSSPGVDRPLRSAADFRRNLNRDVEIVYSSEDEEQMVTGKIVRVSDEIVEIQQQKQNQEILLTTITKAKIHLPW